MYGDNKRILENKAAME